MKTSLVIALVLLFAIGAFVLLSKDGGAPDGTLASYFQDEMMARGIENIGGMPIEGFDEGLLRAAFPGLTPLDFLGVETFEGHYDVEGTIVTFTRDQAQPVSSAERTISEEGYGTLLANISKRLTMPADSEASIDALIVALGKPSSGAQTIETRINQGGSALDVEVVPLAVLEDSRCPIDVVCIQAGTVRVQARIRGELGQSTATLELNQPTTTEA